MSEPVLETGSKISEGHFDGCFQDLHDFIIIECLDDSGKPQGHALGEVLRKYRADRDGAFVEFKYLQCTDDYYRHWLSEQVGERLFHHLCKHPLGTCKRKVGAEGGVVHVQRWAPATKEHVKKLLDRWGLDVLKEPKIRIKNKELEEVNAKATAAKASASPGLRRDSGYLGFGHEDFDTSEEEEVPPVRAGEEKVKPAGSGSRRSMEARPRERSQKRRDEHQKPGRKDGTPERRSPRAPRKNRGVLDAVLEDTAKSEELDDFNERRLEHLRSKLGEVKRTRDEKSGVSAVLAARVQEGSRQESRKKPSSSDSLAKAIKVIAGRGRKRSRSSDSSSRHSSLGGEGYGASSSGSDLASKQRKLRRLAADKPGALLIRGYSLMHEQLGTMYGVPGAEKDPDKVLQPGAMRYLLTCALPLVDLRQLGEEKLRELRTLATGLDLIVSGRPTSAADYMIQRYKSILMGVRDGSNVASKYLELLPSQVYPTGSTDAEMGFAREVAYKHARNEDLLHRVSG